MSIIINSNEQLITRVNRVLKNKKSPVNIINDKLTLSVFSEIRENTKKVKETLIRDSSHPVRTGGFM
jgi:hypothetical protein